MEFLKIVLTVLASAVLFLVGYAWLGERSDSSIEFYLSGEVSPVRPLLLLVTTVVGIFAKSLHSEIDRPKRQPVRASPLRRALTSKGFKLALLVSPIVFLSVYRVTNEQPDQFTAFLLAFQNGFFWKAIFEPNKD